MDSPSLYDDDYLNRLEHTRRIYGKNEEEARAIADSILCSAPHVHNGQWCIITDQRFWDRYRSALQKETTDQESG